MSDIDPAADDTLADAPATAAQDSGGPPGDEPPGGEGEGEGEETPWYKKPLVWAGVAAVVIAALLLVWANSDDDTASTTTTTTAPTTGELIAACLAQDGPDANEACAALAENATEEDKAAFRQACLDGEEDFCRLLELIGEPVPTPTTTAPPAGGGNTTNIIVIPPPEPGEPTPPDPTIPDLPDPTLEELAEACLEQDGQTSDDACDYLADNLTDSQKDAIRQQCTEGNEDACRLLELIGEDVPESTTSTSA